uniref:Uncharacterized protein n=1 Tax=Candidatus Kentrum sp. DK TaxID=2126562 RepID=A0A450TP26_9GAMM|nr:MAG: hypothetical protein BECKDK2373C_GA0170839_10048 [Candidatus Kentron sp. DK]VFJ69602.1 MAG: hypothetical protein BECKDK2373B_GA0170837_12493 [Candidatus Kentron sp. DK]
MTDCRQRFVEAGDAMCALVTALKPWRSTVVVPVLPQPFPLR